MRRENFERELQICGVGGFEFEALTRCRVFKPEPYRVQPLPRQSQSRRERRVGTVQFVADERVAMCSHVNSDLVRATRLEFHLDEAGSWK